MSRPDRLVVRDGDVDTATIADFERDRRELVRRGVALGGGLVLATSIPLLLKVRHAFAQADGDAAIIESAVGLEQIAVFAYTAALDSGVLSGDFVEVARTFRDQEQEHVDALTTALRALGGELPAPPEGVGDVDEVLEGLGDVRSQADVANFALELETAGVAAYYEAHQQLRDAALLQTGTSIMANEGQHLVVLRQTLDMPPVPNAFETGEA